MYQDGCNYNVCCLFDYRYDTVRALDNILIYGYICINNKITMDKSMNGKT